jgi:Acyltransferase family
MDMPEMSVEIESSRNATVDYARFVGAIAIVWFHFKMPGAELGYAALPMFLIIQIYYLILNRKRRPLSQAIRFSFFRLLRPWLAWSLIFACLKIGQALIEGHPITDEFFWWMLLSGTEIHLWYLPFSFILGTLTLCVVSQFEDFDRYFIVLLIAFVPCSLISAKLASDPALGNPFTQWSFIFPAGLVGIMAAASKNPKIDFSLITICSVLVYFISLGFGWQQVCLPLLLGTVFGLFSIYYFLPLTNLSRDFGRLSFGIYLAHPMFSSLLMRIAFINGYHWLLFILTLGLSIVTAKLLGGRKFIRNFV